MSTSLFKRTIGAVGFVMVLSITVTFTLGNNNSSALSGSEFKAGRIIDDAYFYNGTTMSAAEIQNFLNAKVPTCDTWGTQPYGGTTRAEYGASRGYPAPYTCLKDYRQDTGYKAGQSGLCSAIEAKSGRTAAQIIDDVARACHISQKVLLVMLQKEQGLVTDDWPWSIQYRGAMGYGCPDTAACDSEYYGFFNQVYNAALQFQRYKADPNNWNHVPFMTNQVLYQANAPECGSRSTYIENYATAGLYNYTPYTPNQAALNNLYDTGDSCSAYGNRNFWRYYNDWFGSPIGDDTYSTDLIMDAPITMSPASPRAGDAVTVTFRIKNNTSSTKSYGTNILQCRIEKYKNCDSAALPGGSLASGATKTFSYTIIPSIGGTITLKPYFVNAAGIWSRYGHSTNTLSEKTFPVPHLRATGQLSYGPKAPNVGEIMKFSIPITNNGAVPITISTSLIQCRINGVTNCDSPLGGSDTIAPGATRTYRYSIPITIAGEHTFTAYYRFDNRWFKYISGDSPVMVTSTDISIQEPFAVSDATLIPHQQLTTNYTLVNNGQSPVTIDASLTQCRFDKTTNCDPSPKPQVTIGAGAAFTVSDTFKSSKPGTYRFMPYYKVNGEYHTPRTATLTEATVRPYTADMRVTDFVPNNPNVGDPLSVTYTVKNSGSETAYYQDGVLQCRYGTTNCDSAHTGKIDIAPGASRTFTEQLVARVSSGKYTLKPFYFQNGKWNTYKNADGGTDFSPRTVTVQHVKPQLSITDSMIISSQSPRVGDSVVVKYTITNNASTKINVANWVTQCRIDSITNCDNPWGSGLSLNPGQSIELSGTHSITRKGSYRFIPYVLYDNIWYTYTGSPSLTISVQ